MALAAGEIVRLERCLSRLRPHIAVDDVALTGGVALVHWLGLRARDSFRDVDFVMRSMDAFDASVTRDFLVSHRHVSQPGVRKAMLQLVDPATRLRIDAFPDVDGVMAHARLAEVAGHTLRVLAAQALLAHKRRTLARASAERPVDEKHYRDALALAEHCGEPPPARPMSVAAAIYSTDVAFACEACERSRDPAFPLAPKRAILELLGYV